MAMNGLRDQDRLDGASNFVVWKARILSILDRHRIKVFALRIMPIPLDLVDNDKYEEAMAKAKCIILDGVKDHVVQHIAEKDGKGNVEYLKEDVPAYFRAKEDAT